MKRSPLFFGLALTLLPLASARAQPATHPAQLTPPPAQVRDHAPTHAASLTLSPVHLAIGVVELTSEFRLADKLGVAGTLGGGKHNDIGLLELGAQLCYYLTGDFDGGLHLGLETQYVSAFRDATSDMTTAKGEGLAVGSMIGWKWIGESGLSFVAQAGAQYMALQAEAQNGTISASQEDSRVGALVNLNAGWSF